MHKRLNNGAIIFSSVSAIAAALLLAQSFGWRQSALFLIGLCAGLILHHAAFGFTAAWREFAQTGDGGGLRAQLLMLAVTVVAFSILIDRGEVAGVALRGSVAPLSAAVVAGAFIFGIGMQLGGGCASGTLFTVGGGNSRMLVTLIAFVAGSVLGSWHWGFWQAAPRIEPIALTQQFGVIGGIAISLILFATVWALTLSYQRKRQPAIKDDLKSYHLLRGPWPLIAGALALASVNCATLLLAGRPWGVTSAFTLWGAKLLTLFGADLSSWEYWARPSAAAALEQSLLADVTSVMNFGIMLGALLASGLAEKFSPTMKIPAKSLLAAVIGGIMLGYGARIAYGCNIGAYFGGISSTSLHGWLWFGAALAGSTLGTKLRPRFSL
jgi:uncharacterized membrane protein YedE/YeeE